MGTLVVDAGDCYARAVFKNANRLLVVARRAACSCQNDCWILLMIEHWNGMTHALENATPGHDSLSTTNVPTITSSSSNGCCYNGNAVSKTLNFGNPRTCEGQERCRHHAAGYGTCMDAYDRMSWWAACWNKWQKIAKTSAGL